MWQILLCAHVGGDMGDLQFLQQKSDAGNLIIVTGNRNTAGVIVSYTVPNGKTFVLYKAKTDVKVTTITNDNMDLRNNGIIRDTNISTISGNTFNGVASATAVSEQFIIEGDTLVGDGVKTFDINLSVSGGNTVYGTIIGYLE